MYVYIQFSGQRVCDSVPDVSFTCATRVRVCVCVFFNPRLTRDNYALLRCVATCMRARVYDNIVPRVL